MRTTRLRLHVGIEAVTKKTKKKQQQRELGWPDVGGDGGQWGAGWASRRAEASGERGRRRGRRRQEGGKRVMGSGKKGTGG